MNESRGWCSVSRAFSSHLGEGGSGRRGWGAIPSLPGRWGAIPGNCSLCCEGPHKAKVHCQPHPHSTAAAPWKASPFLLCPPPPPRKSSCRKGGILLHGKHGPLLPAQMKSLPGRLKAACPLQTHGRMGSAGSTYRLIDDRETGLALLIPKQSSCLFSLSPSSRPRGFPRPQGALCLLVLLLRKRGGGGSGSLDGFSCPLFQFTALPPKH